jgi:hypothetical protein
MGGRGQQCISITCAYSAVVFASSSDKPVPYDDKMSSSSNNQQSSNGASQSSSGASQTGSSSVAAGVFFLS